MGRSAGSGPLNWDWQIRAFSAGFVNPAEAVMGRSAGIGRSESFLPDLSIRQEQWESSGRFYKRKHHKKGREK